MLTKFKQFLCRHEFKPISLTFISPMPHKCINCGKEIEAAITFTKWRKETKEIRKQEQKKLEQQERERLKSIFAAERKESQK